MTTGTMKCPQGRRMRSADELHDGAEPRRRRKPSAIKNYLSNLPQRPAFRCWQRVRCTIRTPP